MKKENIMFGLIFFISIFYSGVVSASCVIPYSGMVINESTTFCQGEYFLDNGVIVSPISDNIILDCNNSMLIGNSTVYYDNSGFLVNSFVDYNVTIKNCIAENYTNGFFVINNLGGGIINFLNNFHII